MREAFENSLLENPDDLAGWCAYADYLAEQGDPRGEFMQTQLALEDESRPKAERDELKAREAELLAAHERVWLGGLAHSVLDTEPIYRMVRRMEGQFTRGWLTELLCRSLSVDETRVLACTPEAKMLGRLLIESIAYENSGTAPTNGNDGFYQPGPDVPDGINDYDAPALHALRHVPHLAGVRVFRYGDGPTAPGNGTEQYRQCHTNGAVVHEVAAQMLRLEELYLYSRNVNGAVLFALPLPRLRVLRVDHEMAYPLEVLAANSSLGGLTHLFCHPHAQRPEDPDAYIRLDQLRAICRSPYLKNITHLHLRLTDFGDEGIEELIASGLLGRLRVLDLRYGCVTDRGATLLAACPEMKNLTLLDLSQNAIGETGIALLEATGVLVNTDEQHGEHPSRIDENGYLEYLSYGDME